MDRYIARFGSEADGDLRLCYGHGVAYQADMSQKIEYGDAYLANYETYAAGPINQKLNNGRCALLARHAAPGATVLDIGAATGEFVRFARSWGFDAYGFDVIPEAVRRLQSAGLYADDIARFDVVTFWDSLEHIEDPGQLLDRIRPGAIVLAAIPVVSSLRKVRESKHYKPGEHFYHFCEPEFFEGARDGSR